MQINLKSKYSLAIVLAALGVALLYNSTLLTDSKASKKQKPEFFQRMPTNVKKIRQHINIDIDYEKLPARNEIRLIGRVNSQIEASKIDYKWTLKDNLTHKRGSMSGTVNLKDTQEITLDVAIKNMNKRVNVRLEAYAQDTKIKIGGVRTFIYDPSTEDLIEAERMEAQSKVSGQNLSKEEMLSQQLKNARKPSFKQ